MRRPKLLFLATEDWFIASHFRPLLRRALSDGFEAIVAARQSGALADMSDIRVIDTPFARGSMQPWQLAGQVAHLRDILACERPDIVHAIALKPAALLALSGYREGGRVFAITGRGYLGARETTWTRHLNRMLRSALRGALCQPRTLLLVENTSDRDWLGRNGDLNAQTLVMPGAGVDPDVYAAAPEPATPPVVVGVVARLIWSKGIDLAVEAVQRLRDNGETVALRIAGDVDPESPESVSPVLIDRWRSTEGVEVLGRIADVSAFWAEAHIACLPSRGGEGLPRSLLEAAACRRPIVTTDAAGCRDFVRDDMGIVVPRENLESLGEALQRLVRDGGLRAALGKGARERLVEGYTEEHAAAVASNAWARLVAR